MPRVLLIANQTLQSKELEQAVEDRLARGACEFVVVVPVTRSHDLVPVDQYGVQIPCDPSEVPLRREEAVEQARRRLEPLLEVIRASGAAAAGVLGDSDPWHAFKEQIDGDFDEVIISTLAPSISRWLRMDLVSKIERAFDGRVSTISAGT